ncbi:hypothetical protein ADL08_30780, partial [Streptomyces sp. NRRL F-6492]
MATEFKVLKGSSPGTVQTALKAGRDKKADFVIIDGRNSDLSFDNAKAGLKLFTDNNSSRGFSHVRLIGYDYDYDYDYD